MGPRHRSGSTPDAHRYIPHPLTHCVLHVHVPHSHTIHLHTCAYVHVITIQPHTSPPHVPCALAPLRPRRCAGLRLPRWAPEGSSGPCALAFCLDKKMCLFKIVFVQVAIFVRFLSRFVHSKRKAVLDVFGPSETKPRQKYFGLLLFSF